MPWKVAPVSEIRLVFVHHVRSLHHSVAEACRFFGISRKTRRAADDLEQAVLKVRDDFGWGPRKIHAFLRNTNNHLPSIRTIASILKWQWQEATGRLELLHCF